MAIERVGFATATNQSTITPPTGSKAGDIAVLVTNAVRNPGGWTELATSSPTYGKHGLWTRVLTGAEALPTNPSIDGSRMEVWRGVGEVLISSKVQSSGNITARALSTGVVPGSVPLWAGVVTSQYTESIYSAPGVTGGMGGYRSYLGFGDPVTGTTIPAKGVFNHPGAGSTSDFYTLALTPGAPPYNMFRIDAAGETGLTPYLLGATSGQDTEIRWTP